MTFSTFSLDICQNEKARQAELANARTSVAVSSSDGYSHLCKHLGIVRVGQVARRVQSLARGKYKYQLYFLGLVRECHLIY